jgi:hypothetical protein
LLAITVHAVTMRRVTHRRNKSIGTVSGSSGFALSSGSKLVTLD